MGGCWGMTYKACVDYARYYRKMASVATTAEAWRLYKQLADLWDRAGSELRSNGPEPKKL